MNNPAMDIHAGFRLSDYMVDILKITGPLSRDQLDQFQNLIEIQQSKLNVLDMRRKHIEFLAQNHNNNKTKVTWQQPKHDEPSYTDNTSSENDGEKLMKAANILQDLLPKYFTRCISNQETQTSPRESVGTVNRTGIHTSERRLHDGVTQTEAFDPTVVFVEKMYIVMLSAVNNVQAQNIEGVELFLQCCLEEIRKFQAKPSVGTSLGKENELDNFEIGMENVLLTSLESMRNRREHDTRFDERYPEYEYEESLHMETVMEVINDMVCHDVRNEDIGPSRTASVPTTFEYNSEFELNKSWSHPSTLSYYESETARPFNWTTEGKVETLGDSDTDDEYFRDKLIVPKLDLTFLKELEPVELSSHDSDSSFWSVDLTERGFKEWLETKGIYVSKDPEAEKAAAQQQLRIWKSNHSLNINDETDIDKKGKTRKSKSMAEASQVTTKLFTEAAEPYGHGDVHDFYTEAPEPYGHGDVRNVLSVIYEEDYLPEHVEKTGMTEAECAPVSDRTHQARIEKAQKAISWVDSVNKYMAKNEMICIPDVGDGYLTDDECTDISDSTSSSSDIIPPPMMKSDDDIQSRGEANDIAVKTGESAKISMATQNTTERKTEEECESVAKSGSVSRSSESMQMNMNSDSESFHMTSCLETDKDNLGKSVIDTHFPKQDESYVNMEPKKEKDTCLREAEPMRSNFDSRSDSSSSMTFSSEPNVTNEVKYSGSKPIMKKDEMNNKEELQRKEANTLLSATEADNNSLDSMQPNIHSYAESLQMSSICEPKDEQVHCNKKSDETLMAGKLSHQSCLNEKKEQNELSKVEEQQKMNKDATISKTVEDDKEEEQANINKDNALSQPSDLRQHVESDSNKDEKEVPTDTESDEDFITGCINNVVMSFTNGRTLATEDNLSDKSCSLDIPTIPSKSPSYFMRANKIDSDRTESSLGSYHEADIVTLGSWDTDSMEECLFLKYSKKKTSTDAISGQTTSFAREEGNKPQSPGKHQGVDKEQDNRTQSEPREDDILVQNMSQLSSEDGSMSGEILNKIQVQKESVQFQTDREMTTTKELNETAYPNNNLKSTQNIMPATVDVWVDENDIEVIDIESMEQLTPVTDNRDVMPSPPANKLVETTTNRSPVNQSPDYVDVPRGCDDYLNGETSTEVYENTVIAFQCNNDGNEEVESYHGDSDAQSYTGDNGFGKTGGEDTVEKGKVITSSNKTGLLGKGEQNVVQKAEKTDEDIDFVGSWDNDDIDENGDVNEHENVVNQEAFNSVVETQENEREFVGMPFENDNNDYDPIETNDTEKVHDGEKGIVENESDKTEKDLLNGDKLNVMNQGEETDDDIESAGSWDNDDSDENDDVNEHENVANENVVNSVVKINGNERESVDMLVKIDNKDCDLSEINGIKKVLGCDKGIVIDESHKTEKDEPDEGLNVLNKGEETDEDIESAGSWDNDDSDENDDVNKHENVEIEKKDSDITKTKDTLEFHGDDKGITENNKFIPKNNKTGKDSDINDKNKFNVIDQVGETDEEIESAGSWVNEGSDKNDDINEQDDVKNQDVGKSYKTDACVFEVKNSIESVKKEDFSEVEDPQRDNESNEPLREQCRDTKYVTFANTCVMIEPDEITDSSTQALQSDQSIPNHETSNVCISPEQDLSKGTNSMYNGALIIKDVEYYESSDDCSVIDMPESELVRWQSKRNGTYNNNTTYLADPPLMQVDLDVRPEPFLLASDHCLVQASIGNQLSLLKPHKLGPLKPIVNAKPLCPTEECSVNVRDVGLSNHVNSQDVSHGYTRNYPCYPIAKTRSQSLPKPRSLGPLRPVGKMLQSLSSNDQTAIITHVEPVPLAPKSFDLLQPIENNVSNQLFGNDIGTIKGRKDQLAPLAPLINHHNTEKKKIKKKSKPKTKEKKSKKKQSKSHPTKPQEQRPIEVHGSSSTESFSMPSFEVAEDIFRPSVDRLEDDFIRNSSDSSSVDSFRRKVVNISRGAAPMDDDFEIGSYESSNESYGGDKNYNCKIKARLSDFSSNDKKRDDKKCTMNIYQSNSALPWKSELPHKDRNEKKNTVIPENEPRSRSSIKPLRSVGLNASSAISYKNVLKTETHCTDLSSDNHVHRSSIGENTWVPKNRVWDPLRLENGRLRHASTKCNDISQSKGFVKERTWEPLQVVDGPFSSQFRYMREP